MSRLQVKINLQTRQKLSLENGNQLKQKVENNDSDFGLSPCYNKVQSGD